MYTGGYTSRAHLRGITWYIRGRRTFSDLMPPHAWAASWAERPPVAGASATLLPAATKLLISLEGLTPQGLAAHFRSGYQTSPWSTSESEEFGRILDAMAKSPPRDRKTWAAYAKQLHFAGGGRNAGEENSGPLFTCCTRLHLPGIHLLLVALPALVDKVTRRATSADDNTYRGNIWGVNLLNSVLHALCTLELPIGPAGQLEAELATAETAIRWLLERGADLCSSAGCGNSALTHALATREPRLAELLLKLGASPNQRMPNPDSPTTTIAHVLTKNGRAAALKVLLDHGVSARLTCQVSGHSLHARRYPHLVCPACWM